MRMAWFRFSVCVILAHALAWAQQPSNTASPTLAYETGGIANNVYTNECFGFSFAIPEGWQINTQLVGADARARHTTKGALALLQIDQHKEGSFANTIALNAHDASVSASTAQEFVSNYARGHISSDRERRESVRDTYSVGYAGKIFFRADNKQTMSGGHALYLAFVYTKFRGFYIGETLIAGSEGGLELAANSLQGISFREDEPNSKCVMRGDDSQNSGGIIAGVIGSVPRQSTSGQPLRVRISEKVSQSLLITKLPPHYPEDARRARIQGMVVLTAWVDTNGDVEDVTLVSGHPLLAPAALEAVKQWKYKPYLLNGQPVKVETQVTVAFELSPH